MPDVTKKNTKRGDNMKIQTNQTTIYIGFNDSETGIQKFDSDKYASILKNICRNYKIGFSVQKLSGGYFFDDGRYTEENGLMLRLIDVPEQTVTELAKDICVFFNQESVMVTTTPTSVVFIKDSI
jgi:hypothetical protein